MQTCEEEIVVLDGEDERIVLVDTTPAGLPWGESCSPFEELPKEPVDVGGNSTDIEDDDENGDWEEEDDSVIVDVDNTTEANGTDIVEEEDDEEDAGVIDRE